MPVKRKIKDCVYYFGRVILPDGKVREKKCSKKAEAYAWEQEQKQVLSILTAPGISCGEWAESYLDGVRARGLRSYDNIQRAFRRFFEDVSPRQKVSALTSNQARLHLDRIAQEISGTAANKAKTLLSCAWTWGSLFLGLSGINPFVAVAMYKAQQQALYVPPVADFWKVYNVANEKHQVILLCYLFTAARRDEIKRLKWTDVDFENGLVRLWTRKRKSGWEYDWIPLVQTLAVRLKEWKLKSGPGEYVFMNPEKTDRLRSFRYFMPNLTRRAGVRHFGVHAIRHLTAVSLYQAGETVATIQQVLRHESPSTTEVYLRSLGVLQLSRAALDRYGEQMVNKIVNGSDGEKENGSVTIASNRSR